MWVQSLGQFGWLCFYSELGQDGGCLDTLIHYLVLYIGLAREFELLGCCWALWSLKCQS
ncbi:hypothetical protein RchiOBHm_Chr3g0461741 [Rosa chinensis]|uniref:Uncharacterized protein n=1 Tax=Rosa chinensis TaxID=74649 RepID=A0A2P6R8Q2_ROSCH|nr:hypothetical protein RchiOBHm_Chr3g0461741 [Rosa chinensis]